MTKKKVASALFAALVVLTLISCCFLGSTFARYVSGGNGSASTGIAKWDINVTGGGAEGATEVNFEEKLSPSMEEFTGTSDRKNETGKILIATIENAGEVKASVTVSAGGVQIAGAAFGEGINTENWTEEDVAPTQWQVEQLFSVALYQDTSETYASGEQIADAIELDVGETVYIFAEITWTSLDTYYSNENVADSIDTWVGENITSISYAFTYRAVQASELPQ